MAHKRTALPPLNRYPWDEWTNGEAWEVRQGTDFDSEPKVFRQYLYDVAKTMNRSVRTRIRGDCVFFQFADPVVPYGGGVNNLDNRQVTSTSGRPLRATKKLRRSA